MRLIAAILLAVLASLALAACGDPEIQLLDVSLASDTLDARGPFEIVAALADGDAVTSATLHFRAGDDHDWSQTPLRPRPGHPDHLVARISPLGYTTCQACPPRQTPWPLGTRIDYWLELRGTGSNTVLEPENAPRAVRSFIIGAPHHGTSVLEVSPRRGPASGGTRVFVRGTGFRPDTRLHFGAARAEVIDVISPALIVATTPPGPGNTWVDVSVRAPGGQTGSLRDAFFYVAPPSPLTLDPAEGPTAGGTVVTITGEHFDASRVSFGTHDADLLVATPTTLTVRTPEGPPGLVDVTVTNRDGQQGTLEAAFRYIPPPAVLTVEPSFGPSRGGTRVTLNGRDFLDGAAVTFDGVTTPCQVTAPTRIQCVTLPHLAAVVDVEVTNPDGQRALAAGAYEFMDPPQVLAVVPPRGPITGGTDIEIVGRNFLPAALVELDQRAASNCLTLSRERIACQTPPAPEVGLVDVAVTNPDGQSGVLPDGFEYTLPPPSIVSISPASGSDLGGTLVTLRIDDLQAGAQVFIGDAPCVIQTLDPQARVVTCITQAHPEGFVDVVVINPDGQLDRQPDFYRYVGPPRILSIDPPRGPEAGGTLVTITGENFVAGMTVTFDGLSATVISVDEATGTAVVSTPPHALGFVDVTVTNPDARSDTAPSGFEYVLPPPVITQLLPPDGPTWGGDRVVIVGTGFRAGATVLVGGEALAPGQYVMVDGTRIEILAMPPGRGTVLVEVVNPDGQSAAASYTYVGITLSPSGGLLAGHTRVVISGRGFAPGATVRFGTTPALSVTRLDERTLVAQSPPGTVGAKDVVVTLADGRSETVVGGFSYRRFVDTTAQSGLEPALDCQSLALVDLDRDGNLDTVVGRGGSAAGFFAANSTQRNNGNGTFGASTALTPGERNINLAVADFDGDGDVDVLDINLDDTSRLFVNNGSGTLSPASGVLPFAPQALYDAKFLDLDRDGDLDLVLLAMDGPDVLLRQRADRTFETVTGQLPPDTVTQRHDHDLSVGDVDGDGYPDLFVGVDNTLEFGGSLRFFGRNRLYRNNRMGGFTLDVSQPFTQRNGDTLDSVFADIDGDGDLDLLMSDNILQQIDPITLPDGSPRTALLIYLNNGSGSFTPAHDRIAGFPLVAQGFGITPVDLDADGDLDLILSTGPDATEVDFFGHQPSWLWVNDGTGHFVDATGSWPAVVEPTQTIQAGDLDGDGHPDLVFCNFTTANRLFVQRAQ